MPIRLLTVFTLSLLLLFSTACAAATSTAPSAGGNSGPYRTASVQDLNQMLANGESVFVLDVRTPAEYTGDGHIAGSTLIPVDQVANRLAEIPTDQTVACFCRSGNRSQVACQTLANAGYTNLLNIDGGITAWKAAGFPVEN